MTSKSFLPSCQISANARSGNVLRYSGQMRDGKGRHLVERYSQQGSLKLNNYVRGKCQKINFSSDPGSRLHIPGLKNSNDWRNTMMSEF